jgi:hypothetical protein
VGILLLTVHERGRARRLLESATSESLVLQFELDFSLITCMDSSASGLVWYLDSGTSYHMMGDKESFS